MASINTMKPQVVFLDWDGTVCGSRFWGHWEDDRAHAPMNQLIQEQFFRATPGILTEWMRGEWSAEDIAKIISQSTAIPASTLLQGLRESCELMQLFNDNILPAVKNLRDNGVMVVVATDNMDTFTRWTVPALKLDKHFDDILSSHTLRALKRDKDAAGRSSFFGRFFAENQIDSTATVLIDDGAHNAVVKDFGMRFMQVTPELPAGPILMSLAGIEQCARYPSYKK